MAVEIATTCSNRVENLILSGLPCSQDRKERLSRLDLPEMQPKLAIPLIPCKANTIFSIVWFSTPLGVECSIILLLDFTSSCNCLMSTLNVTMLSANCFREDKVLNNRSQQASSILKLNRRRVDSISLLMTCCMPDNKSLLVSSIL